MAGAKELHDKSHTTDNGLCTPHAALATPHEDHITPHKALATPHEAPSATPHEATSHEATPHEATPHETPSRSDLFFITLFAVLGRFAVYSTRLFPAAFYIEFLKENNLNKTIGTICISTVFLTTGFVPYLTKYQPRIFRDASIVLRSGILILILVVSLSLMYIIDPLLRYDPDGVFCLALVAITRAVQGLAIGLINIIVQGEIVDKYLTGHRFLIVVISSTMHMAAIVSILLATEVYVRFGWVVGPVIGLLCGTPLLLLPKLSQIISRDRDQVEINDKKLELVEVKDLDDGDESGSSASIYMTPLRHLTFYMPELGVLLDNMTFNLMIFVLPTRLVEFTGMDLNSAALILNLQNLFSLISAILMGLLAEMVNVFSIMLIGNVLFYAGAILAFGSTTEFLSFPFEFEIGSVLAGLGISAIVNLAIMSKFVLYDHWGLPISGLGVRSTKINNLAMSLSACIGTALSGVLVTRESEVAGLSVSGAFCVMVMVGLILCKVSSN